MHQQAWKPGYRKEQKQARRPTGTERSLNISWSWSLLSQWRVRQVKEQRLLTSKSTNEQRRSPAELTLSGIT
jgi:hypothetical protein